MQKEALLRRLLLARYMLRLAAEESRKPEPLCSAALLLLHDSVELVLALAAEHLDVGTKKTEFKQYFGLLEQAISPVILTHKDSMRRLNDARVGLKHYGTTPARREVLSFQAAAVDFIQDNVPRLFGLSFDDVSLADLVETQLVRECLKRTDAALAGGNLDEASCGVAEAFARLLREFKVDHFGRGMRSEMRDFESQLDRTGRTTSLTRLGETVDALQEEVALLRHGIDTRMLTVFRALMPSAAIMMAGNARFGGMPGAKPPSVEEIRLCYGFVVDSALRMQEISSAVADLSRDRYVRSRFGIV